MITTILARFPFSSDVRGPRVVLYEFLGGDVSLGHWNPYLAHTKTNSAQFCYSLLNQTGVKLFFSNNLSASSKQMKYCV